MKSIHGVILRDFVWCAWVYHHCLDLQEKTREQREAEVIPRITEALRNGINVMDNAFVTLELTTERE